MPCLLFTLNDFDNQKRNLTLVKMDFQVLKVKFQSCNFKQAFYPLHKLNPAWPWQHKILLYSTSFSTGTWLSNLHVQTRH